MYYLSETRNEFYRDTGIQIVPPDVQIRPLAHLPGKNFNWYRLILVATGNLLIVIGLKLKTLARPAVHFSQEAS